MDTDKCIAQIRGKNGATVRILRISPNEILTCDRNCNSLEESEDGSIQCRFGSVKKMVNFQTTALVIDYEVVMDRKAEWQWLVNGADFVIVDDEGHIHEGDTICRYMKSPKGLADSLEFVYPGTRAQFRVYYDTFPKEGKIASFICNQVDNGRIDFMSQNPLDCDFEEERREMTLPTKEPATKEPDDMRERMDNLEREVRRLREIVESLQESHLKTDSYGLGSRRPMSDPGIEYHPLEKK